MPLWDELTIIRKRLYPDIVVVDDVHAFGSIRELQPEWEHVTRPNLDNFMGLDGEEYGGGYVFFLKDRQGEIVCQ